MLVFQWMRRILRASLLVGVCLSYSSLVQGNPYVEEDPRLDPNYIDPGFYYRGDYPGWRASNYRNYYSYPYSTYYYSPYYR